MLGKGRAQQTALGIEYKWDPEAKFARAALADRYLPDGLQFGTASLQGTQAEMLSTEGDTDHWEAKILVSDPKSANEIIDVLRSRIKSGTSHTRGPVTLSEPGGSGSAGSSQITWTFTNDQGLAWRGVGIAEGSQEPKGKVILTLKVARVG